MLEEILQNREASDLLRVAALEAMASDSTAIKRGIDWLLAHVSPPDVMAAGLRLARAIGHPDAAVLRKNLDDEDPEVRAVFIEALGNLPPEDLNESLLIDQLVHPDNDVKNAAIRELSKVGSPRAIEALRRVARLDTADAIAAIRARVDAEGGRISVAATRAGGLTPAGDGGLIVLEPRKR